METDLSKNALYAELIKQDEIWRTGDGEWIKLEEMSDDHLENLLDYLEEMSVRYQGIIHFRQPPEMWTLSGCKGRPDANGIAWMKRQPIYKAVKAELDSRKPKEPLYTFTCCEHGSTQGAYNRGELADKLYEWLGDGNVCLPITIERVS